MNREWEEMKNKATAKFSGAKISNDCLGSVWSMYVEFCVSAIFFLSFLFFLCRYYRFDKYSKRAQLGQDADQLMTEKSNVQINHWLCCACAYSLSTYSINGLMASRLYDAVYCIVNWVCARNSVRKFIWLFKHAPYKYQLTLSLFIWMYVLYVFLYAPCISYVLMTHTCILKLNLICLFYTLQKFDCSGWRKTRSNSVDTESYTYKNNNCFAWL